MRNIIALLGKGVALLFYAIGYLLISLWAIAAIAGALVYCSALIVAALPSIIGHAIENWTTDDD